MPPSWKKKKKPRSRVTTPVEDDAKPRLLISARNPTSSVFLHMRVSGFWNRHRLHLATRCGSGLVPIFFFLNLIMRPQLKPQAIVTMDFARHSFHYEAGWDKFAWKFFRVELVWSQRRLNPHDFLSSWSFYFKQDCDWSHRAGVFLDLAMTLFVDGNLTNGTNGQRIKNCDALSCSWLIFLPSRLSSQSAAPTHLC